VNIRSENLREVAVDYLGVRRRIGAGRRWVDGQERPVDEEQLVRLVAGGDRAAFDELYRRTSPWLAVRLRRRCHDDELVAEVLQDT
jgi:hypothetical protein